MLSSNRSGSSISVFFPAFNDEKTIKSQVTDALTVLPSLTDDFEVLIVNDGSTDSTPAVLDALAHAQPHVRVIHYQPNQGYGAECRTGFAHARKDLIFYTEILVNHYPRRHGRSQFFTLRRVARTAFDFIMLSLKLVVLPFNAKSKLGGIAKSSDARLAFAGGAFTPPQDLRGAAPLWKPRRKDGFIPAASSGAFSDSS